MIELVVVITILGIRCDRPAAIHEPQGHASPSEWGRAP
jgi:hypothetical protein